MRVTFLGTGTSQGIPIIGSTHPVCLSSDKKDKRLRVSILIEWKNAAYVIDCGPDFRQQMLRANCTRIDGILFTHEHADHTAGLDDIRPFFFRQGTIPIYAHQRVLEQLHIRFAYIFQTKNKYPGAPSVIEYEVVNNNSFLLKDIVVTPVNAWHDTLQVFGYRFENFAYLTDVKSMETKEKEKLKGLSVLVVNALRIREHASHFSLQEALDFIAEIQPEKAYLTHISHLLGFHAEVSLQLPENVFLAYDTLTIDVED